MVFIYLFRLYLLDKNYYLDNLIKFNVNEKYGISIVFIRIIYRFVFFLYLW